MALRVVVLATMTFSGAAFAPPAVNSPVVETAPVMPAQAVPQQSSQTHIELQSGSIFACSVALGLALGGMSALRAQKRPSPLSSLAMKAADKGYPEMSPSVPYLKYPERLWGMVGGEKGFDPLRTSDIVDPYTLREAELKHGRVAMLATVGWIATDLGARFTGQVFQVSTLEAHDKLIDAGIMVPLLGVVSGFELIGLYLWRQGETKEIQRAAGDFFIGKNFLPKDAAKAEETKLKELENGRLAMMAISGIATTAALFPSKPWPFF